MVETVFTLPARLDEMISYRTASLCLSIVSFGLAGYDRIAAEFHAASIRKSLHEQVVADDPRLRYLQPAERVRTVLRAAEIQARNRGEPFSYQMTPEPHRIAVAVNAPYRTKIAHLIGMPEMPANFTLEFTIGQR